MPSTLFLSLCIMALVIPSTIKLHRCITPKDLHNFDYDATLPIRGLLALLIVAHHLGQRFHDEPIGLFISFGAPIVTIFFFISGYGLMSSYIKKGDSYFDNFFKRRLGKILPLFIILTLLSVAFLRLVCKQPLSQIFEGLILYGNTPLYSSWFIYAIIIQYCIFYISCKLTKSKMMCIFVNAVLTLILMYLMRHAGYGPWWYISMPAFVAGIFVSSYEEKVRTIICRFPVILLIIGCCIPLYTAIGEFFDINLYVPLVSLCPFPIVVLMCTYALGTIKNRALSFLGNISLEIYLFQGIFIPIFYEHFYEHFHLHCLQCCLLVFAFTIASAYVSKKVMNLI